MNTVSRIRRCLVGNTRRRHGVKLTCLIALHELWRIFSFSIIYRRENSVTYTYPLCIHAPRGWIFNSGCARLRDFRHTRYNMRDTVVRAEVTSRRGGISELRGKICGVYSAFRRGEPPMMLQERSRARVAVYFQPWKKVNVCHVNPAIYIKPSYVQRVQVSRNYLKYYRLE